MLALVAFLLVGETAYEHIIHDLLADSDEMKRVTRTE